MSSQIGILLFVTVFCCFYNQSFAGSQALNNERQLRINDRRVQDVANFNNAEMRKRDNEFDVDMNNLKQQMNELGNEEYAVQPEDDDEEPQLVEDDGDNDDDDESGERARRRRRGGRRGRRGGKRRGGRRGRKGRRGLRKIVRSKRNRG